MTWSVWLPKVNLHEIEIEHQARFVKVSFATAVHDLSRTSPALKTMVATTECVGEIRVRRFRDKGLTVLKALVRVQIPQEDIHDLNAEVSVRLAIRGDQFAASPAAQERFTRRLHEIAQQHCLEFVGREIRKSETIPLF